MARLILSNPQEALSRTRSRIEIALDRPRRWTPAAIIPDEQANRAVHELVGVSNCKCEWIDSIWSDLVEFSSSAHSHDASRSLVTATCVAIRHVAATTVVETGVARGFTSFAALSAIEKWTDGRLVSVDLPPILAGWDPRAYTSVVPPSLRSRWRLVRGSTRSKLPAVLNELGEIDVFIHDSLHTRWTMTFEFKQAWAALRPGGVLISDDVQLNHAYANFCADVNQPPRVIVDSLGRHTGIVRKP